MLKVDHLTKQFKDFTAVDDVTFEAQAGEIFGILGPNGAGKTTTIRVIATILEATGGTAIVKGFDIKKNPEEVRKNVGLLTSDIGMYDRFTARENLRYFGELYGLKGETLEKRIDELIGLLDMKRFADRKAGKFSTGMKQKVAIARSVIHNPDVIIFDEPTAGLDVLASQTVIRFMKQMRDEGKLVILSTHDMAHAQSLCDRVAIIHRAKIIAVDTIKKILKGNNTDSLEEAFIKIVGADEAKAVAKEDERKSLARKGDVGGIQGVNRKTLQGIRYSGIAIMLLGFSFQVIFENGQAWIRFVSYVLVGIGLVAGVISGVMLKRT